MYVGGMDNGYEVLCFEIRIYYNAAFVVVALSPKLILIWMRDTKASLEIALPVFCDSSKFNFAHVLQVAFIVHMRVACEHCNFCNNTKQRVVALFRNVFVWLITSCRTAFTNASEWLQVEIAFMAF